MEFPYKDYGRDRLGERVIEPVIPIKIIINDQESRVILEGGLAHNRFGVRSEKSDVASYSDHRTKRL